MKEIDYYLVDVFTSLKYGGNQLAVFIDYKDEVSYENMLNIARELNFPEITFVKKNHDNKNSMLGFLPLNMKSLLQDTHH